jgi:tRNA pseudouridine38-40 synthase
VKAIRCAVWVWYRGDHFRGFQAQLEGGTVQQAIAGVLRSLGCRGSVVPAGRTDRGVHARMQVVSIRLLPAVSLEEVVARLQRLAPGYLGVVAAKPAELSFHPGWRAIRKEYRYRVSIAADPPESWRRFVWRIREHPRFSGAEPSAARLANVLRRFEGARDFAAFHEKSSPRKPRRLQECSLREVGGGVFELRFVGVGFARYQVRYLAGAAALVTAGILPEEALEVSLAEGSPFPGLRAPPEALVLWDVAYPPDVDPFSSEERAQPRGLPEEPPFSTA